MPGADSAFLFFSTLSHPIHVLRAVTFTDEYALHVGMYMCSPNTVDELGYLKLKAIIFILDL